MSLVKKIKYLALIVFLLPLSSLINIAGNEEANNNSTKEIAKTAISSKDEDTYVELYRNSKYIYSYKESLDIIQIQDVNSKEILWKTGADVPYQTKREARDACRKAMNADPNYVCDLYEDTTGNSIINSLVTAYIYKKDDKAMTNLFKVSSAHENPKYGKSTLMKIDNSDTHYRLDFQIGVWADINLSVHIYFDEKGIEFELRHEEITGADKNRLIDITIAPFIGATGGEGSPFVSKKVESDSTDPETGETIKTFVENGDYDTKTKISKEMAKGYIIVPDGSGAIIPFVDSNVTLGVYKSYVYGQNYTTNKQHYSPESGRTTVPLKDASMPMFGVVHNETATNSQKAVVAYATKGEQHMAINVSPDNADNDSYIYAYATFRTNFDYTEYYSQDGTSSAPVLNDNPFDYDIGMRYDFLEGDNANYVGVAKAYRDYLINEEKQLTKKNFENEHIITRLDFIMADAEESVLGTSDAVVTTANDVKAILNDSLNNGIDNIVTSLLGWQSGGITLGRPDKADFTSKIGTASEYKSLISSMEKQNVDVSFSQDYFLINESQISFSGNATKHYNGKYIEYTSFNHYFINEFGYARSDASLKWVKSQNKELSKKTNINSMTVTGISNRVLSNNKGTREKAMENIENAFKYLDGKGMVNAEQPNKYLWKYVDRYFNIPVFNSQHLIEETEIPLLQLVLNGCMELYAPYSNFSFYDQESILKMIDFNVYPSFVLSQESSHYLSYTNSSNYYSTEYSLYKEMIKNIYTQVDSALGKVINADWINRTKLENGLIVNEYSNGKKIVINYSDSPLTYGETKVSAQGFEVL